MVEAFANSIEDKLVDSLQFKLKEGASYINSRRSVSFYPQGSNIYTSKSGAKVVRILLTGDNWLDPSTVRISFDVVNNDPTPEHQLRPIGSPWAFFKRFRLLCQGAVVEDISEYARTHEMMHTLTSKASRENDFSEAFGNEITILENYKNDDKNNAMTFPGITGGQRQTVLFKVLSGLLSQNKFLPLSKMGNLTLEFELSNDPLDAILKPFPVPDPDQSEFIHTTRFHKGNTSENYSLENFVILADVISLDNGLQNNYDNHLLQGNAYAINYNTFITQNQNVLSGRFGQKKISLSVSRAVTRLKSVFVTLDRDVDYESDSLARKNWNDFYSPMHRYSSSYGSNNSRHDERGEFECQLIIGSRRFPEKPITSHAEAYYNLKKCLGVQSSSVHSFDISALEYRNYKMILGFDLETLLGASFTGLSTRAGDLLTFNFAHAPDASDLDVATQVYITLHSDNILEIRDSGVTVFD